MCIKFYDTIFVGKITKLKEVFMIKRLFSLCLTVLLASFVLGFNVSASAFELSSKTPILIQSDSTISAETNKSGDNVNFHIVNVVRDTNGNIVFPAGTPVKAAITRLEPKNRIGRPAELSVAGFTSTLYDGRQVAFSGSINKKSESRMARSIVLSALICPLFLLMKGTAVELPAGVQTTVYPAVDYSL